MPLLLTLCKYQSKSMKWDFVQFQSKRKMFSQQETHLHQIWAASILLGLLEDGVVHMIE